MIERTLAGIRLSVNLRAGGALRHLLKNREEPVRGILVVTNSLIGVAAGFRRSF